MIRILKASAGSGKTFNLARTYIRILLTSTEDHPYRHILAVTFTNKATAEMKSRILRELSLLATRTEDSGYFREFVPALFPDSLSLKARAEAVLIDILHDYSAFSVSTIDKFFQQTLKAFSREIGQFSSYQIELDRQSLVHEAVDRMLDSITDGRSELREWLDRSAMEQVGRGDKLNLEKKLYEIAEKLSSEELKTLEKASGVSGAFSKSSLDAVRKECSAVETAFAGAVKAAAGEVVRQFDAAGVSLDDTYRGFLSKVGDYAASGLLAKPTEAFLGRAGDPDMWFTKTGARKFMPMLSDSQFDAVARFVSLWDLPYREYNTAVMLKSQTYSLGVAEEFRDHFDALLKEKNVLGLEDSNSLLRDIIDGSDAPFVYEKLGVRYENFLLDEFQDTSVVQWQNFLPLLKESHGSGRENLIVGDVKQSIYRWRGSEWELLSSGIGEKFPDAESSSLQDNWRSTAAVVEFNNSFFLYASKILDSLSGTDGTHDISDIYCDVAQNVKSRDPQQGSVEVTFCEDELGEVLSSIVRARDAGAGWGDIAVLVRNNHEGGKVAEFLIGNGVPVLSDDSLDVKSSLTVRRLTALLSCVENPGDRLASFLSSQLDVTFPTDYHSLADLCEALLRELKAHDPSTFAGEVLYVQSFMDSLQDWSAKNGNNLMQFLKYWGETSFSVSSPADTETVRVMTIHKSKGLEFPYVIFPFAEKVTLSGEEWHWCRPDADGTGISSAAKLLFPVSMVKSVQNTLFSRDYFRERRLQLVDSINTFYVALTRAGKALHVIAAPPCGGCAGALRSGSAYAFTDFSQILYHYVGSDHFAAGKQYDFSLMERKEAAHVGSFAAEYPSIPVNPVRTVVDEDGQAVDVREQGRLKFSADSVDFFGDDGTVGAEASNRLNGIVLHAILSDVKAPEDLRSAVDRQVMDGQITSAEGEKDYAMLFERIASARRRGWFPDDSELHNEEGVIGTDGQVYRPDRVVVTEDHTIVIDFKFGSPKPSYRRQVERYVDLYRRMGYPDVTGYLWYVPEDKVEKIL